MNLDQDFFQVSKLNEDQKKESSPEMENFFSPNIGEDQKNKVFTRNGTLFLSTDLRSDAHQSQCIGGSSVARGGGGAIAPPIGLPIKMQNKENTTFLTLLRLSFALD